MKRMVAWLQKLDWFRRREREPSITLRPWLWTGLETVHELGVDVPERYYFHPCHTWAFHEGMETVRVGLDSFAAIFLGEIEHIDVVGLNRWVRQGQRLMTVTGAELCVELLSPLEGEVKAVNRGALQNPRVVVTSPYEHGWIATIYSPHIATDLKNLLQGPMAVMWMRKSRARLRQMALALAPSLPQENALSLKELLASVSPELKSKLVKEYFLTAPVPTTQGAARLPGESSRS
jgi:glycine cleavage system H lipoate-binding protein